VESASKKRFQGATFVGPFVTREVLAGFRRLGLPLAKLCAAAGMTPEELMDPDARIPTAVHWALWREAERLSGDPSLGFHTAEAIPMTALGGPIGQLAAVSETGLDAVRLVARYGRLISDGFHIELHEDETTVTLELRLAGIVAGIEDASARHSYESFFAVLWRMSREMFAEPPTPTRVSFRHSPPPDVAAYERFFGCPVVFSAPAYRIQTPRRLLEQPTIASQPRAATRLQDLLESELRTRGADFTVAVAEQIRAALEQHERPTPASIARRLAIGQRTLQRRLREEGSSFSKIFEREQRDLAVALLRHGSRVIDVAYAVGFGDATNFSKAFRRWTGASPSAYRARAVKREPGRS
jgi:AraC-like DNA-binding protein